MTFKYPLPIEDIGYIYEDDDKSEIFSRQIWRGSFDEFVQDLYN